MTDDEEVELNIDDYARGHEAGEKWAAGIVTTLAPNQHLSVDDFQRTVRIVTRLPDAAFTGPQIPLPHQSGQWTWDFNEGFIAAVMMAAIDSANEREVL